MRIVGANVRMTVVSLCALSCGLWLVLVTTTASGIGTAGNVQITVTDQAGTPIPNVNLCLTILGQSTQRMTDQNGRFNTGLPEGSTTVRTSRTGYANRQETITVTIGGNFVRQIVLQPGQATPLDCGGLAGTTTPASGCAEITNLEVAGGPKTTSRTVGVVAGFARQPTFFRMTEFSAAERYPESQFNPDQAFAKKNVPWQPVTTPILTRNFTLTEPHFGTHHVYLQTSLTQNGCVSHARGVSITLEPAKLQTYQLDKKDLLRFLKAANSLGYQFHSEFRFLKKDHTYCVGNTTMVEPADPLGPRKSNAVIEDIGASFEVFIGPALMPFWEIKEIEGFFPGLSTDARVAIHANPSSTPVMQFESYSKVTCPYCNGPGVSRRTLSWRRILYEMYPSHHIAGVPDVPAPHCVSAPDLTRPDQQPFVTKLTLVGPAGEDPITSLPLVLSGQTSSTRLKDPGALSPTGLVRPRGVEDESAAP